ncbi:serine hydrolase [Microbulbifer sp. YPW1]|uniref:serine hydrolase domain-containing protein n=2 Tax=unclassified Microbulbifer TaxID=2619833 RepID=UPI0015974960|nr:serine hydrolase [Microbulbifer sp. YPW1]QKX18060.1 serine hydrolase [Microbulbifer sp. YPW1]
MGNLVFFRKTTYLALSVVAAIIAVNPVAHAEDKYATAKELGLMEGFPPPPDKRVTKANALQTPPYNRWAYQHMRMFYPTANVPAADVPVPLRKDIDPNFAKDVKINEPGTGKTKSLAEFLKETWTDAIVVIHDDKIVYEKFLNGMTPNTPHQMMSATKSFGGLLGLVAVANGKLKESDPVTKYVPELNVTDGAFANATFGQVLDMTNSMDFSEVYDDPRSGIMTYAAVLGWVPKLEDVEYPDSLYEYLVTLKTDKEHKDGEIFHYQTPKTDVVNWVTNRVNNASFQQALYDEVWSKIGTEGETYVLLDNNATLVAGGGLNATPYNLARFAKMMLNNGEFNGKQVIPKSVVDTIAKGGSIEAFDAGPDSDDIVHKKGEWSYRGQWWVKHTPGMEAFMAIGVHGQWIYIDRNHDIAIVKVSSMPVSKDTYLDGYNLEGFYGIVKYLANK